MIVRKEDMYETPTLVLKKDMCCIYYYCVYNISVKDVPFKDVIYIGQTRYPIKRHRDHLTSKKSRCPIDKLLRTHHYSYGILWIGPENQVDDVEKQYIEEYQSMFPYGFNFETGGRSGANIRHVSEETKKKKYNSPKNKPVLQYDLYGMFIKKWDSIRGACRELGFKSGDSSAIVNSMHGKRKYNTTKGYLWREYNGKIEQYITTPYKFIIVLNDDGKLMYKFKTYVEAGEYFGVSNTTIKNIITGKSKKIEGEWKLINNLKDIYST